MKSCPTCGTSCEDGAIFCPSCGADLSEGTIQADDAFSRTARPSDTEGNSPSDTASPFGSQSGFSQGSGFAAGAAFGSTAGAGQGSPFSRQQTSGGYSQSAPPFGSAGSQSAPGYGAPGQQSGPAYGNRSSDPSRGSAPYGDPRAQSYGPGQQAPLKGNQPQGNQYQPPYGNAPVFTPAYDHTADFEEKDISDNKVICMCIYLLGTIGLFIALLYQKSEYVTFHIRQSLKLTVLQTLVWIAAGILSFIFSLFSAAAGAASYAAYSSGYYSANPAALLLGFGAGSIPLVIALICTLAIFVVRIICFVQICKGKAIEAPIARSIGFMK